MVPGATDPRQASTPEILAAVVAMNNMGESGFDGQGVYENFQNITHTVGTGNMEAAERMLMSQALALRTVATNLFLRASASGRQSRAGSRGPSQPAQKVRSEGSKAL